jgi:hypothetical protein
MFFSAKFYTSFDIVCHTARLSKGLPEIIRPVGRLAWYDSWRSRQNNSLYSLPLIAIGLRYRPSKSLNRYREAKLCVVWLWTAISNLSYRMKHCQSRYFVCPNSVWEEKVKSSLCLTSKPCSYNTPFYCYVISVIRWTVRLRFLSLSTRKYVAPSNFIS